MDFSLSKQDTLILKGIAIIGMICWHLYFAPNPLGIDFPPLLRSFSIIGDTCVSIFLFISGYGLTQSYQKQLATHPERGGILYVVTRLLRLYSSFWIIFLIFVPLGIILFDVPLSTPPGLLGGIKEWVCQLLGLSEYHSYNAAWWYLSLVIPLYILYPMLYHIMSKYPLYGILACTFIVNTRIGVPMSSYIPIFLIGILWSLHQDLVTKIFCQIGRKRLLLIVAGLFVLNTYVLFLLGEEEINMRGLPCFAVYTILFALLSVTVFRTTRLWSAPLTFFGRHATNIYLVHSFIYYYWFFQLTFSFPSYLLMFVFVLGSSLVTSFFLECIKTYLGWNKVVEFLIHRINGR